jgi:hypothetical protein
LDVVDAEEWIHRRPTRRKRAVQAGLAFLCILVVLGLFHSITPGPHPPSATNPAAGSTPIVVSIVANLSFGTVSVNGKPLSGKPPYSFQVAPGGDTVRYLAPPFSPQTCRVFWYGNSSPPQLGAGGTNCELSYTSQAVDDQVKSSYVLNFEFRLEDLPAALQTTAVSFLRQIITPVSLSTTVPRGQYYATGRDSRGLIVSRRAASPLTARVSLRLPTAQDLTALNSWCPELICAALNVPSVGDVLPGSSKQLWAIQVPLALDWHFVTRQGQVVGTEHQSQLGPDTVLILAMDGRQNWHLGQYSSLNGFLNQQLRTIPNSLCTTGMNELLEAVQTLQPGNPDMIPTNDHGVEGCEIELTQNNGTSQGMVVWRLGVLLAADTRTHSTYPWLPLAPRAELEEVS